MQKDIRVDTFVLDTDGLPPESMFTYISRDVVGARRIGERVERSLTLVDVSERCGGEVKLHVVVDPGASTVTLHFEHADAHFTRVHSLESSMSVWDDPYLRSDLAYEGVACSGLIERRLSKVVEMFTEPGDDSLGVYARRLSPVGGEWLLVNVSKFIPLLSGTVDTDDAPSPVGIVYADERGGCDGESFAFVSTTVETHDYAVATADQAHLFMSSYEDEILDNESDSESPETAQSEHDDGELSCEAPEHMPDTGVVIIALSDGVLEVRDDAHGMKAMLEDVDTGSWSFATTRDDGVIDLHALSMLKAVTDAIDGHAHA